jgi:PAS domain S-box-containing protein
MENEIIEQPLLVWLVDDEEDHLELIGRGLAERDRGLVFRTFSGPARALGVLQENPPDVIISDYDYRGDMDGIEFLGRLREAGCTAPFIFLTGKGNESVAAEALRKGAEDYFTKETGLSNFPRIANAIRRAVRNHWLRLEKDHYYEKYAASQVLCEQIIHEVADFIAVLDEDGTVLAAGRQALQRVGYQPEDLIGRKLVATLSSPDREIYNGLLASCIREGVPSRAQFHYPRPNGERRLVDMTASLVVSPAGRPQIITVSRDITDFRVRETAFAWTRQLLDEVLEALNEVVHVVDRDLIVLYCNRNIAAVSRGNVSSEGVIGRYLGDIVPAESQNRVVDEYRRVFEEGESLTSDCVNDYFGHRITTRTVKIPVRGGDGRVDKIVTILRDISPEHTVQLERRKLFTLADDSLDGIGFGDPAGNIEYSNKRLAAILGYPSPLDLRHKPWPDILDPAEQEAVEKALSGDGRWEGETSIRRADGRTVPAILSLHAFADGTFHEGVLLCIRDLSAGKATSRRLAQVEGQLDETEKEYREFIGMVSHELRSPLTNIDGFARLLEERIETASTTDSREFVSRIVYNAARLQRLIDGIVTYARERRRPAEIVEIRLKALLEEVLSGLAGKMQESGAEIVLDLGIPLVRADRDKLVQILETVLENAVTYRREGVAPLITVSARSIDGEARINVADNGRGLAEAERELVFEVFRRGSSSRGIPGTGIGLALSRANATALGGSLTVESKPGGGAVFTLALPLEPEPLPAA